MDASEQQSLQRMANALRALSMDAVEQAQSGHPGMPMGMADAAAVLWARHMKYDAADPAWPDRDRFVLSAGHGSMLLYSILHLIGVEEMTLDQIRNFRQLGAITAGHPEYGHTPGVEATTGPLGQGISMSVGMALAERMLNAEFGDDLVDHRTWVIASDGDLQEGISHEAISLAGHWKLDRLCVLWDDNEISIDGPTSLADSSDVKKRFEAAGWAVTAVDGHDLLALDKAMDWAKMQDRPVLIACKTTIGLGAPTKAGKASSHGAPLGAEELAGAREYFGWEYSPFDIPEDIRADWAAISDNAARAAWCDRLGGSGRDAEFEARISDGVGSGFAAASLAWRKQVAAEKPVLATRQASAKSLGALLEAEPSLVGGSADLTGSNGARAPEQQAVFAPDYDGRFLHFGIREHGMAACANGMALHGGFRPYVATFLVFADYCRPAMRLSALMQQGVTYVMTHDSIGLGEDGPTHQPVETLASLRAMPNMRVFRPADALETAEAWELALSRTDGPSVIALSRQKTPHLRRDDGSENLSARGAYVLREAEGDVDIVLIGTGTETALAVEAAELLAERGVSARVVSAPSLDLFMAQDEAYRDSVAPNGIPRVAIEAAVRCGWDELLAGQGDFVGMSSFGGSAPAEQLYEQFGVTAKAMADKALALLGKEPA